MLSRSTLVVSCAALLGGACGGTTPGTDSPPSAVLITLDTTRVDALGCYGGPAGLTPHLDGLAADGVVFDNAHTVTPLTLPSHASMLTGLTPLRHGVRINGSQALGEEASTLAERARDAGVQTAAFVSSVVLGREFGLDQGFEHWDQPRAGSAPLANYTEERAAGATVANAVRWLAERDTERPFLLWVHLYDPHAPYAPPPAYVERAGGDAYRGEVAWMDDAIGTLLAALRADDAWSRCTVLVASDHGEGLGEHGEPTHGYFLFESTMRIPLLLRAPGLAAGRSSRTVGVSDVFPTLQAALGLPPRAGIDGVSLLGADPGPGPRRVPRGVSRQHRPRLEPAHGLDRRRLEVPALLGARALRPQPEPRRDGAHAASRRGRRRARARRAGGHRGAGRRAADRGTVAREPPVGRGPAASGLRRGGHAGGRRGPPARHGRTSRARTP